MNSFVFQNTTKVYFGENQLHNLGAELGIYGKKVLLTYGGGSIKKSGLYDKVVAEIKKAGLELYEYSGIAPNPRVESVNEAGALCKKHDIDVILAVGGGSVIDCSKFIASARYYDGDAWDLSTGKAKTDKCIPLITVLTLSATGSEMNAGGVISNLKTHDKLGNNNPLMQPKVSFLDPTNTYTVDKYQTACGSTDILSHLVEVYFAYEQDLMMLDRVTEGLFKTVIENAPIALKDPTNYHARANLMWASSWAINGLIRGGKQHSWTCHPIEHQLSAYYDISHGLGLAILMPRWMEYVLDENNVDKFVQFGTNVFDIDKTLPKMEIAKKAIKMFADFLFNTLGLTSRLSELKIDSTHFEDMAKKCEPRTLKGFKSLTTADVIKIYEMCL